MPHFIIPTGELPPAFIRARLDTVPIRRPFLARVPAGFPSPAEEYLDNTLNLHDYLVQNKTATFYFRVDGDSMRDDGILDGDILVVDRSVQPTSGRIVVAAVNGQYTVKRLYRRANVVELRPANPAYQPIRFNDGEELVIWGVVKGIVRAL